MRGRIVDLTFPIEEGMTTFPTHWHPFVEITQLGRHGIENRETRKITLGTHTGTHCDAPRHFIPGGTTIDRIALESYIGPAVVLDFSSWQRQQAVEPNDLADRLGAERPERVLLRYDWAKQWGSLEYYSHHPFLSPDAAQWLVDRGVRLVGMDTPMPDNPQHGRGTPLDSPNHKTLLGNGVLLIEYLCNLDQLRSREVYLIAMPLKITGGDGAPARCAAIDPAP